MEDPINRVYVLDCNIYNGYTGVLAATGIDGGPDSVWIRGNSFRDLGGTAISADTIGSVSSIDNSFAGVAVMAISWSSTCVLCQSMGDVFDAITQPNRIYNGNPGHNLVFDVQHTELVNNQPSPMSAVIDANQTLGQTGILFDVSTISTTFTLFIDYSLNLDSYRKAGRLTVVSDGATAALTDTGVELNASASVVFSVSVTGGLLEIYYTSTGLTSGTLSYIQTTWSD